MREEYARLTEQLRKITERRNRTYQTVLEMQSLVDSLRSIIEDADTDIQAIKLQLQAMRQSGGS